MQIGLDSLCRTGPAKFGPMKYPENIYPPVTEGGSKAKNGGVGKVLKKNMFLPNEPMLKPDQTKCKVTLGKDGL
jgi:hypothetical protein